MKDKFVTSGIFLIVLLVVSLYLAPFIKNIEGFTGLYDLDKKELQTVRSVDNIIIKMRFTRSLNYIEVGQQLAFREGQTKGVGVVIHLLPY